MSLGGIAIAVGAMVDAVIIMIENAHKHMERDRGQKPHWDIIRDASLEVGPTLFYSLLVIAVSLPAGLHAAGAGRAGSSSRWPSPRSYSNGRSRAALDHPGA
jgi:Cu(I)/Ag(I) efflux system membrane protein CusA/SilA